MSSSDSGESKINVGSEGGVTTRRIQKKRRSIDPEQLPVRIKVPSFSPDDPDIWFAILEGQFANYGIDDDATKFNNVVTRLGIAHAKAVKDIIMNPPAQNRYERIKSELIKRLTASHEKKVRQLLSHEEIGDRKASAFLRHLRDLAGPEVPDDFLRSIWSNRLPHNIQTVLASQSSQDLEQLADLADRIQEISTPGNVAAAAATNAEAGPASSTSVEIAELRKMVERLAVKLDEHTRQSRSREQRPSNRSRRHQPSSRSRTRSTSSYRRYPICWYHKTFGSQARQCQSPCDFGKSENATGNRQ